MIKHSMCFAVLFVCVLALTCTKADAIDCYQICDPEYRANTTEYLGIFWCGDELENCAIMRADFITDYGVVTAGQTTEYSNYAIHHDDSEWDVYYGDCVGEGEEETCEWIPDPGNTHVEPTEHCTDCPL